MTKTEKKRFRDSFFRAAGRNVETIARLFEQTTDIGFYIKDAAGRIVTLNRRNCDICNIKDEWDAVGMTSAQLFPANKATSYMSHDKKVIATGKPLLGWYSSFPADDSRQFEFGDIYPICGPSGKVIGTACAYRLTAETKNGTRRYRNLRKVSDHIQSHYAESIRLADLASMAGMSQSTFIRSFRSVFGTSPTQYVVNTRINAARKLLETTDLLLSDIALECGFFDQSHMTKVFQASRGITPGEYRRHYRDR